MAGDIDRHAASPSEIRAEQERLAGKLLKLLAEPGTVARRHGRKLSIVRQHGKVSLQAATLPSEALAPLIASGAVETCILAGKAGFILSAAGKARLFREQAGDDGFAGQHRQMAMRPMPDGETVRVNLREDPLEMLRRQKNRRGEALVNAAEISAGERLRRDLAIAGTMPRVTANWSRMVVDGAGYHPDETPSEAAMAARQRVRAAMTAVGPDFSGVLIDLCGFSKGVDHIEEAYSLPVRSGKVVLSYALRALARHYGLAAAAIGPSQGKISHWGTEDYKPRFGTG